MILYTNWVLRTQARNEGEQKKGFRRLLNLVGNCFTWLVETVDYNEQTRVQKCLLCQEEIKRSEEYILKQTNTISDNIHTFVATDTRRQNWNSFPKMILH